MQRISVPEEAKMADSSFSFSSCWVEEKMQVWAINSAKKVLTLLSQG